MKIQFRTGFLIFFLFIHVMKSEAQSPNKARDISPLLIGEKIPTVRLKNVEGKVIELSDLLKKKQSILIFYRGGWCPYCNMQLSDLASVEQEILKMDYQIIAISPDYFENIQSTQQKHHPRYSLLSDEDGVLIEKMGIGFKTPILLKSFAKTQGQKGSVSKIMPVPSVFVVNTKGKILFEYINIDYKKRISADLLISVLQTL